MGLPFTPAEITSKRQQRPLQDEGIIQPNNAFSSQVCQAYLLLVDRPVNESSSGGPAPLLLLMSWENEAEYWEQTRRSAPTC